MKIALEDRTEFYTRPWRPPQHEPLTEQEENVIYSAQERDPGDDEEFTDAAEGFPDTEAGGDAAPGAATEEPPKTDAKAEPKPKPPSRRN